MHGFGGGAVVEASAEAEVGWVEEAYTVPLTVGRMKVWERRTTTRSWSD